MHRNCIGSISLLVGTTLTLASCVGQQPTVSVVPEETSTPTGLLSLPRIIEYPTPDLTFDTTGFEEAGCALDQQEPWLWRCPNTSVVAELGCEQIEPDDLLAGLTPHHPVARCMTTQKPPAQVRHHFKDIGCRQRFYTSYIMFKDNAFHLISTIDSLRTTFAPIESTDEALSYALVATDLMALYDLPSKLKGFPYDYLVDELEETHVEYVPEGYVVHLYALLEPWCGCAFHVTAAVDVIVTEAGGVKELEPKPQFQHGSCVD